MLPVDPSYKKNIIFIKKLLLVTMIKEKVSETTGK